MIKTKEHKREMFLFCLAFLAYSLIYVARMNFSVLASALESEGKLNRSQIGIIGCVFSIVYAVAKVPNGYLGDRFNTREIILTGLLLAGISNVIIGLFPTFFIIVFLWGINAYGQSMLWGPMLRSVQSFGEENRTKELAQYLTASIGVGSVIGLLLATGIVPLYGSGWGFIMPGILCIFSAMFVRLFFIDVQPVSNIRSEKLLSVILSFIRDTKFQKVIIPALAHGIVKDNVNVWMVIYIVDTYNVDLSKIGSFIFFIPLCTLVGRLLFPVCYRTMKNTRIISAISFLFTTICSILLCFNRIPMWVGIVCMGAIAAFSSLINTYLVSMFPMEEYGGENLSFAASTMDLLIYGGAGIGSLIFGVMIDHIGYGAMFITWAFVSLLSISYVFKK